MRIILFLIISISVGCTSQKSIYYKLSNEDKNKRQIVVGPQFETKLNPIGIGSTVMLSLGGAYAGYLMRPVENKAINIESHSSVGINGIVGAGTGLGIGYFMNNRILKIGKKSDIKNSKEAKNWVRKFDKNKILLTYSSNKIRVIDKSIEYSFDSQSLDDIRDFLTAFPESRNMKNVYLNTLSYIERDEIPMLITLFKEKPFNELGKVKYYEKSQNIAQLKEALAKFPETEYNSLRKAVSLTRSFEDAKWTIQTFNARDHSKEIFINSLRSRYSQNDYKEIKRMIGEDVINLEKKDLIHRNGNTHKNYMAILNYREKPKTLNDLIHIYSEYNWLEYSEKKNEFMDKCWKLMYNDYSNGDELLAKFSNLFQSSTMSFMNINKTQLSTLLQSKLELEIRKNIVFYEKGLKSPKSDGNFDVWKSSIFYDSPYLYEKGELVYLYHGTIYNRSKFTLPLEVTFYGDLIVNVTMDAWNLIKKTKQYNRGTFDQVFYLPKIEPAQTLPFAVLFDLGKRTIKEGINVIGVQGSYELNLDNLTQKAKFLNSPVSKDILNKQKHWLSLEDKTLSKTRAKEIFGYDYDPSNYIVEIPTSDYYRSTYGEDCGCNIVSVDPPSSGFLSSKDYYTLQFENGYSFDYHFNSNGKIVAHDGIIFKTKYSKYKDFAKDAINYCLTFYCD